MNRPTDPAEAAPEPAAPEAAAAVQDNASNSVGSSQSRSESAHQIGDVPSATSSMAPRHPSKPAARRQALWASLLGVGALGVAGAALWTRSNQAPATPGATPSTSKGASAKSDPNSIASIFGMPGAAGTPAADAPLFPGLGQLGAPSKGASAANSQSQAGTFGALGKTGAAGAGVPGVAGVPAPVQAAFARAVAAQKAGHVEEAVQQYREVLRLKPDAVEAHANLAILFAGQKQPERAITQLQAARKLAPRQPAILFQLAQALLQAKRPGEAVEPLQAVLKLDAKNPAPQLLLAQVLSQLGRSGPALAAWERVCELDPKNSGAALAAGAMALEGAKQPERAVKWLRKAVALAPPDAREPLLLGRALMASKKPAEAAAVLKPAFTQFPKVIEIGTMLADARVAAGDIGGAIGALREVIKRVPEDQGGGAPAGQLRIALARMLGSQKKFEPAQAELTEAARLLPRDADVRGLSVDMALKAGDWPTVARSLDQMIELDPKRLPARVLVAREAARRKQLNVANEQYAKYLSKRNDDAGAVAERAVVLEKLGRTDEADAQWKRAVVLLPDNPLPALQRARALHQAGRDAQALEAFRFVLQNWSGDPNALLSVAELEMKLGQPARAMSRWRALIGVRPAFEPAYAALLETARQVDQLPSALGFLKQQVARDAERPALYEAVLNVHARLGRASEGRAWVSNVSRLYPSARAPRRALAEFARRFPSLARDNPTPAPTVPRATPSPKPTAPAQAPTAAPAAPPAAIPGAPNEGQQDAASKGDVTAPAAN